jgi:hypothetical protein
MSQASQQAEADAFGRGAQHAWAWTTAGFVANSAE